MFEHKKEIVINVVYYMLSSHILIKGAYTLD